MQRWFRVPREAIYRKTMMDLKPLSREIEMDETMFGSRKPDKRGWGTSKKILSLAFTRETGKS